MPRTVGRQPGSSPVTAQRAADVVRVKHLAGLRVERVQIAIQIATEDQIAPGSQYGAHQVFGGPVTPQALARRSVEGGQPTFGAGLPVGKLELAAEVEALLLLGRRIGSLFVATHPIAPIGGR